MNVAASTPGAPNCREGYGGWGLGVPFAGVYMQEKVFPISGKIGKLKENAI